LLAADSKTIACSVSNGRMILRLCGVAAQLMPTLCATDYKSPYSEAGYLRQREKRSKPLRDTAKHITGIRLSPAFCEWWMGWPIGASASRPLGIPGCHSRPPLPGASSEDRSDA
jgi:hypothetical protein